jgi:cell division protein FtsZ
MGGAMRVSVVATGIDAVETPEEMPRPRRDTQPPPPPSSADHSDRQYAPDQSQADALGTQNQPPKRYEAPERSQDNERSKYGDRAEDSYDEPRAETSRDIRSDPGLQPALAPYRLEEPRFEVAENAYDSEPETFVAPRPREPGTPTPEAMSRLQAAVRNAPNKLQKSMNRVDDAPEEGERRGFGINSLINRMTGQPSERTDKIVATRSHSTSQQAETDFEPEPGVDPDQERIEIPAFLRRQAN